jgi:hypothetical protein
MNQPANFDPSVFLNMEFTEANSTDFVPVPAEEYFAIVDKVEPQQWAKKDGTKSGLKVAITWSIDDAGVRELLGRDKITVRQDLMLDTTEQGTIDMGKGKNVGLGRLREALGLNKPGVAFRFSDFVGQYAKVKVDHRTENGNIYAEIRNVMKP